MLQAVKYLLGSPGDSGFGSKSTAEDVTAACPDLRSITAIITGATSGIGAETARVLAKRGARVVIPARNVKAAEDMRARIRAECPGADVLVLPLDLSSLASVRAFAGRFLSLGLPLHLLIPYDATQAYAVSKLANVLHTKQLALRLQEMGANVTANCVHPGIVRTRLNRDREGFVTDLVFLLLSKLLKTIPQAAATTCYVAAHPRLAGVSGRYFADCNETLPSPAATNRHEAARLWQISEAMICTNQHDSITTPIPILPDRNI